jgi:hypothetical protein
MSLVTWWVAKTMVAHRTQGRGQLFSMEAGHLDLGTKRRKYPGRGHSFPGNLAHQGF